VADEQVFSKEYDFAESTKAAASPEPPEGIDPEKEIKANPEVYGTGKPRRKVVRAIVKHD